MRDHTKILSQYWDWYWKTLRYFPLDWNRYHSLKKNRNLMKNSWVYIRCLMSIIITTFIVKWKFGSFKLITYESTTNNRQKIIIMSCFAPLNECFTCHSLLICTTMWILNIFSMFQWYFPVSTTTIKYYNWVKNGITCSNVWPFNSFVTSMEFNLAFDLFSWFFHQIFIDGNVKENAENKLKTK